MWCIDPDDDLGVQCSCGWSDPDAIFEDNCVLTDIEQHSDHARCIVAYPVLDPSASASGETLIVVLDANELRVRDGDLEWLLEQPDLPDGFRRAAAVHLKD